MSLDPVMLEVLQAVPQAPDWTRDGDLAALRRAADERSRFWGPGPEVAEAADQLAVAGSRPGVPLRVYRPRGSSPKPGVVFFHGGGWASGSVANYDALCRKLCVRLDAVIVSVEYRLAPEHPFPAPFDDALAAVEWTAAVAASLGIDADRLALAGDSAGATLAIAVARRCSQTNVPIAAMMLWYPSTMEHPEPASMTEHATDGTLTAEATRLFVGLYAGELSRPFPEEFAPSAIADVSMLPPTVMALAEYDPIRDEGRNFAIRLADAGVPCQLTTYPTLPHGYVMYTTHVPVAAQAVEESLAAFSALLASAHDGELG